MIRASGKPARRQPPEAGARAGDNSLSIRSPCQKPPFRKSASSPIISTSSPRMSCWSRSSNPRSRYVCTTRCSNPVRSFICAWRRRAACRIPNLTDTTLSTDLLLLDRCFIELRKSEPRAQHWQAKVVGQVQDLPGARERFDGVAEFSHRVPRRRQREAGFLRYPRGSRAIAAIPSRNGSRSQRAPCRSAPR